MDLLDAIGQVGTGLDKVTGGRALRGTLAGKPRELLSIVPFSDSMGLTDEHDATSGRDLTDAYGVTSKGDHSFGANAAGFLADNLLSPGNLLGGYGAFKAAPTIGKGIAAGAKALSGLDLLDHVRSGVGALGRFHAGETGAMGLPVDMAAVRSAQRAGLDTPGPLKDLYDEITGRLGGDRTKAVEAMVQGPQYGGGAAKVAGIVAGTNGERSLSGLLGSPLAARRLADELPDGSKFLGSGVEGAAFETPMGHVVRVTLGQDRPASRLDVPEMLMPTRSVYQGRRTIEHVPKVMPMLDATTTESEDLLAKMLKYANPDDPLHVAAAQDIVARRAKLMAADSQESTRIAQGMRERGVDPWDLHDANYGLTRDGRWTILDPGAVALPGSTDRQAIIRKADPNLAAPKQDLWSDEMDPSRFRFPLEGLPVDEAPTLPSLVRREATQAGVPDLIREYLSRSASAATGGVPAPALGQADPQFMAQLIRKMQELFGGPVADRSSVDAMASFLRDSRGLTPSPDVGLQAFRKLQHARDPMAADLADWLSRGSDLGGN